MKHLRGVLVFFLLFNSAYAQRVDLRFKHLSISDGLSQVCVNKIIQDNEGFIWIATHDGLNRYDGYTFKVYKPDANNKHSLFNNQIKTLLKDKDGVIWVGTAGGGLSRFNKKTDDFTTYINNPNDKTSISSNDVYALLEDSKGRFWVGTYGGGVNLFDKKTGKFKRYQYSKSDPKSLGGIAPRAFAEDNNHRIWIGLDGDGVDMYNDKTDDFTHFNGLKDPNTVSNNSTLSLMVDKENNIWIGTYDGGLNKLDSKTLKFEYFHPNPSDPHSISCETVWSMFQYNDSTIWFGTRGGGLNIYNVRTKQFDAYRTNPLDRFSLNEDKILCIMEDRSGLMWLGTENNGINIYDKQNSSFELYKNELNNVNTLSHNSAFGMRQIGDDLWVVTRGGGLNSISLKTGKVERHPIITKQKIDVNFLLSIDNAPDGKLWIGTDLSGLLLYDPKTGKADNYTHDYSYPKDSKFNQISTNSLMGIVNVSDSVVWFTTWGGGLNKFNNITKKFTSVTIGYPDGKNTGWCIYIDKTGIIWVGTNGNGLLQYNPKTGEQVFYKNERNNPKSLSNDLVQSIYESSNGTMWVGTGGGGLNKFDRQTKTFTTYSVKNGLCNDIILGITEDKNQNLWFCTVNGISKFNPKNYKVTNYYEENGLQGNTFVERSCFKTQDGKLFFGGLKGLTGFYPENIGSSTQKPIVVINNFRIFNKPVQINETINDAVILTKPVHLTDTLFLSYKQSVFSLGFAALDYVNPFKNKYQYKMEGFDQNWIETDATQRTATYTNLPGGHYIFRVRACNSEGVWNNTGTSIHIFIEPPFYKKLWFLIFVFILAVIIIYVYIREREKELIKKREHFELTERTALLQVEAEKLKESEDKFRKMFQNHNAVMLLIDPVSGNIVDANSSACEFYKYTHERICSLLINDIYEFKTELEYQLLGQTISENQNKTTYTHKLGDGTRRLVEVDSAPLETKTEKLFFSIIYDITEKKQAEDALIESYEFSESLLQTIPFGMQIVDEDANILFMSAKLNDTYGSESLHKKCWDVFCDKNTQCEQCPLKSQIQFGITTITEAHDLMNGRIFQIYHTGMVYDKKKAVLEIFHDITERKLAEKEATEVSTRLALATQAGGVGVWDYDLINNHLIWDNQMFKLYGIEPHEFEGDYKAWNCFVHPDDIERFDHEFELAIVREKEFNTEFEIVLNNGIIKNVRALAVVQYDEFDYPSRMIGTNWDITESKQLELALIREKDNAEAASVAKSDFLATMSHEIRTPLNGVIGFSDILMKTKLSEKQKEYMRNVHLSANSLLDLVNDILDFSKIEAGKLELNVERIDLHELSENIIEIMKFKVMDKGIELLLNVDNSIPRFIVADPVRLRQVLINLLGNATKFTHEGEIELKVTIEPIEGNDTEMQFTFAVRDTGIGIPKNKQQSIFESFSQADNSTTRKYGGTGLGLAISGNLVKKMGSQILVSSEEGVGSTFYFTVTFPYEQNDDSELYDISSIKKVLVIDDNATNRNIVKAMLTPQKITTLQAPNGLMALELIDRTDDIDVIILDYHMPDMDGLEVMSIMRQCQKGKEIPIIFLHSSSDDETVFAACKEYNVKFIMQKPLRMAKLFNAFSRINSDTDLEIESLELTSAEPEITVFNKKYTILIVDDNQMNLNLASSLVQINMPEAEIIETKQGTEASALYLKHNPDIVLMDIQMPVMNGYEAAGTIRAVEKDTNRRVPIIALTAGTVAGEKERCIAAGMDDYLPKPLNSKLLFMAFDKYLHGNSSISMEQPTIVEDLELHYDKKSVMEKYDNDEQFVTMFINTAFETMPQYIYDLQEAIFAKDLKQIKFNAHSLKGMSRSICFNIMTDYALKLEKCSESDDDEMMAQCKDIFVLLLKEFDYLKNELEKPVE